MSRFARLFGCWFSLLLVILAGCDRTKSNSTAGTASVSESSVGSEAPGGKGAGKTIVPINREPKSLTGNWVMVLTMQGRDHYVWILTLAPGADGTYEAKISDGTKDKLNPEIVKTVVQDANVKIEIKNTKGTVDFEGLFDGRAIRGTLANGVQELYTARLLNTSATSLADYADDAGPPASDLFQKAITAMKDKPNLPELTRLASENRISPTTLEVLTGILGMQSRFPFNDDEIIGMVNEYLTCSKLWGRRMEIKAELHAVEQLLAAGRKPEVALEHLAHVEELLAERSDTPDAIKQYVNSNRDTAAIQIGLAKSRSKDEADRTVAHASLRELQGKQPYNPEILLALADHCRETKQTDAAIAYYSEIAALPLLEAYILAGRAGQPAGDPTPRELLKQLWIEQKGDDSGLDAHLAATHHSKLAELTSQLRQKSPVPAPVAAELGDHTVLVEFFTGGACPPCVATDIATTALTQEYPASDVVVLRYHQHIPGPDGLTNQDGEDRFAYYEAASAPTLVIDGMVLDSKQVPYSGPMQFSAPAYNVLRQIVDMRRKQSTPIRLQLDASVTDGQLILRAEVTGATEEQLPMYRLRLALAEDVVESQMPNGIRRHEMVVREMPGGARGIAAKKGALKYEYTMPITDLQLHLDEYIQRFEAGNKLQLPPEMKPPIRGPLHLVGWVQIQGDKSDEQNPAKLIVQTASVPVKGLNETATTTSATESKASAAPKSNAAPPAPALPE